MEQRKITRPLAPRGSRSVAGVSTARHPQVVFQKFCKKGFVLGLHDKIVLGLATGAQAFLLAGVVIVGIPEAIATLEGAVSWFPNFHYGTEPFEAVRLESAR